MGRVARRAVRYAVMALLVYLALLPIAWMVSTSLKPQGDWFARPPIWIPISPTVDNYVGLFTGIAYLGGVGGLRLAVTVVRPIINSLLAAGMATLLAVFLGYMAAYVISRYGRARQLLPLTMLTRMLPPIALAIPLVIFYLTLGLLDSLIGLIFVYFGFSIVFGVWALKGFIDEVPREIEEAAMLDGVSRAGVIFTVTLPLIKGGVGAIGLLVFILNWSEFLVALVLTGSEAFTIPVQLWKLAGATGVQLGPMAALSVIAVAPVFAMAIYIQKHLVRGLTFGALRG